MKIKEIKQNQSWTTPTSYKENLELLMKKEIMGQYKNLRVNIETLTEQSKNLREEIKDLQIEYNELEFEIKR